MHSCQAGERAQVGEEDGGPGGRMCAFCEVAQLGCTKKGKLLPGGTVASLKWLSYNIG